MPGEYLPPTQYTGQGDPYNDYGFTPQGDPIMDRYDARGDRLGDALGYTAQGDPYFHEYTARGDQIFRPLDPSHQQRMFEEAVWRSAAGYDDENDFFDGEVWDDDGELPVLPRISPDLAEKIREGFSRKLAADWEIYQAAAAATRPDIAVEVAEELTDAEMRDWIDENEDFCEPIKDMQWKLIGSMHVTVKLDKLADPTDTYEDARYMQKFTDKQGKTVYVALRYREWQKRNTNFGSDPHFADFLVSERYDEYLQHIAQMNEIEIQR